MKKLILILALVLAGCWDKSDNNNSGGTPIVQCSAVVRWEPPYYRNNGSEFKLSDIQKFTIYVSSGADYDTMYRVMEVELTDSSLIEYEIRNIPYAGQLFFYMTVTDKDDQRSNYSNVLDKQC